jgi:uncharacterized protein (TIGR02145 family)
MKYLLTIILSVILLILFIQGCTSDNPATPSDELPIIIPSTTKPIDSTDYSSTLVNISNDSLTFTFENDFSTKYSPAVNDILVITSGEGLLRKITGIDSSASGLVLTTMQATLEDAIEEGTISLQQSLQNAQINKVEYYYEGIELKLNKGQEPNFEFPMNIILYDLDGNHNTTNDQVKLIGNFKLEANVLFQAKISSFKLRNAKIGLGATNNANLELLANLNYAIEKEIKLATVHFSPIYIQLGPLPVIIVIKLDIKAGGIGYANASLSVGLENTVSYEAGIGYVRGQGWNPYSTFNNQFNYYPPVLTANAGARIYVKPEISVGVYGVLAGYANAEAYGEILVDMNNSPWWRLYAGLDFGVGARAKIWSVELFDIQRTVLDLRWLLAEASSGNLGQSCPGIATVSYGGKTYNTVLIGDQCWLRENLDIGTKINGSHNQTNNSVIEKYCYDDNTANCNKYGGLYQWSEAMQYNTNAAARGICPPGWHIPTVEEIETLAYKIAGKGNTLKAIGQGSGDGAGTNTTGFSALLAGERSQDGNFEELGFGGLFWCSTVYDELSAGGFSLEHDSHWLFIGENDSKKNGYSVRCIKD